ncbi:MAG: SDR family NAD(P)-dependent oxidoreductase [Bacillota bacterium]
MQEVVVITGANNGIGLHTAQALAKKGFRVAGLDLSGEHLAELEARHPDNLVYLRCDVTSDEQTRQAVDQVVGRWGRVDVLVNNACIALFAPFEEKSLDDTRREFEVNYFGYIHMIQAVLPHMKAQGGGIIHNFSSVVGITGFAGISGYASTKGAIEALTRTLALELAPYGISVNLVHPPLTRTLSAGPLGVPNQIKVDPAVVGSALANRVLSTASDVTPGGQTAVFLWLSRWYPNAIGRLLSRATARASEATAKAG